MAKQLFEVNEQGEIHWHPHRFQVRALKSQARFTFILKGWRGGFCGRFIVLMADGTRRFVADVKVGEHVLCLDEATLKVTPGRVSHTHITGSKPTFRVTTATGREIVVTGNHPFYTPRGWVECEKMQPQDFVAVPRRLPEMGQNEYSPQWMKLMGYLIGDGGLTTASPMFTNIDSEVLADFANCLPEGCELVHADRCTYRVRAGARDSGAPNPVMRFVREHGLDALSKQKRIPDFVFGLRRESIAPMLNSLFACDGWVDERGIGFCSASKQLARDVQHLLLRFGIMGRLRYKRNSCPFPWSKGKEFHIWFVTLRDYESLFRFAEHIGITSKQNKLLALLATMQGCGSNPCDVIPNFPTDKCYDALPYTEGARGANHRSRKARNYTDRHGYGLLRNSRQLTVKRGAAQAIADHFGIGSTLAFSDIYWDRITKIEPLGEQDTFDITVEDHHNFIADDIFAHNTSWAAKLLETEMRRCGPGNLNKSYFAISPTHKVGEKGLVPAVQTVFETYLNFAKYNKNDHVFTITPEGERALWGHAQPEPTKIVCCYAEDPDSFASATFLGGVADEVGQKKFKGESWTALRARLSTASGEDAPGGGKMGRIFSGSTVYQLNWLEGMWDDWQLAIKAAQTQMLEEVASATDPQIRKQIRLKFNRKAYRGLIHPEYNFIRFDSTANPVFPQAEFDALRLRLPAWFFDMRYRAIFRKPAGTIFEAWDQQKHYVRPFKIPNSWPRRLSVDFGSKNFYAIFWAHDEDRDRHFAYASYHRTDRQIFEHAQALQAFEPGLEAAVGGQASEDYERSQMAAGGVVCMEPPFKGLWTGINTVSAAITQGCVYVFKNEPYTGAPDFPQGFEIGCDGLADEFRSYSRPVDENGKVQLDEDPEDKDSYHWVDNARYYGSRNLVHLNRAGAPASGKRPDGMADKATQVVAAGRGPVSGSVTRGTGAGFNLNRDRALGARGGDRFLD